MYETRMSRRLAFLDKNTEFIALNSFQSMCINLTCFSSLSCKNSCLLLDMVPSWCVGIVILITVLCCVEH